MRFWQKYILNFYFLFTLIMFINCVGPQKTQTSYEHSSWDELILTQLKDFNYLKTALTNNMQYLQKNPNKIYRFGETTFTAKALNCASKNFLSYLQQKNSLEDSFKNSFQLLKVNPINENEPVLFTGYYMPSVLASYIRTPIFNTPVYSTPKDLISVHLVDFNDQLKGRVIRGRVDDHKLIPYYTRNEISLQKKLENKGLEIAWIKDKADLFFIEIQGSATLQFPDGSKRIIHYANENGRNYVPIGNVFIKEKKLPKDKLSMQSIKAWLKAHPTEEDIILGHNPSFVFFQMENDGPFGNTGIKLTGSFSLAADQRIYPAGSLVFMSLNPPSNLVHADTTLTQLALIQDTGGAIKGDRRIDIFWGNGDEAGQIAGNTKQYGSLYILVPKATSDCQFPNS